MPLSVSSLYGENDSEMTLGTSSRLAAATARGSPTAARTARTGTARGRGRGSSGSAASPGTGGASTAGNPSPGTVQYIIVQYSTVQYSTARNPSLGTVLYSTVQLRTHPQVRARGPRRGRPLPAVQLQEITSRRLCLLITINTKYNKNTTRYKTSHQSPAFSLRTLSCSCILRLGWCASRDTRTPHWCGNMTWARDT